MRRFSRAEIEQVRQAADILEIAKTLTALQVRGNRLVGLCPLHKENTPSFSIDPKLGLFHCFGCSSGGDVVSLVMKAEGLTFPGAIERLAERFGVQLLDDPPLFSLKDSRALDTTVQEAVAAAARHFEERLANAEDACEHLYQFRQLPSQVVRQYGVGFAPPLWSDVKQQLAPHFRLEVLQQAGLVRRSAKGTFDLFRNRIMFPITSIAGHVLGFGGRLLSGQGPRYLNSPDTALFRKRDVVFGLPQALEPIRESGRVILVEGYFDVLACGAAGLGEAVSPMGTELTPQQAGTLHRLAKRALLAFDADPAGDRATDRTAQTLLRAGFLVEIAPLPSGHDPDSLRRTEGNEALRSLFRQASRDYLLARLDRLRSDDPLSDAAAITSVLTGLAAIPDPIVRLAYARSIAEKLGLSTESLLGLISATVSSPAR